MCTTSDIYGHNYIGGQCLDCGRFQETLGAKIAHTEEVKEPTGIHSQVHYWAREISNYCGEPKLFGMYLGVIKRIGIPRASECLSIMRQKGIRSGRYFMGMNKKKVIHN